MRLTNYKSKIKEHGLVLLLFVVLTLILTYPIITHLTTHPAGGGGDVFLNEWFIWHINRILTEGGGIAELYRSDLVLYPHGATLTIEPNSLTNTLFIAFPLTLITDNLTFIYNILFLFNFILAGFTMYLLIKYLVKDRAIAFLVGFAYTFGPLHVAWGAGFLNIMSFLWTPLFLFFFFKIFEEQKIRNAIFAAIFLFFLALASWYHLLFALLIAAPYFVYKLISARYLFTPHLFFSQLSLKNLIQKGEYSNQRKGAGLTKHFFARTVLFLLLFGIVILPFMLQIIPDYFARTEPPEGPRGTTISFFNYVLPNLFHPLWREGGQLFPFLSPFLEHNFLGLSDAVVTPGYLVILISLLYLVRARKHLFWFLLAGFFFFISLNPQQIVFPVRDYIPFLEAVGHVSIFSFGVTFSLLLFFGFALAYFLPTWKQKVGKSAVVAALFLVLAVEYFSVPYPSGYHHPLAKLVLESSEEIGELVKGPHPVLDNDFSVLGFPPGTVSPLFWDWASYNMYFQIFHEKPIIGGNFSRVDPTEMEAMLDFGDVFQANNVKEFRQLLEKYNVGYIIVYSISENEPATSKLLQQVPGKVIFIRGPIYIFEVLPEK